MPIPVEKAVEDLGILVRSDLKTLNHTVEARCSGLSMLRWLCRALSSCSSRTFRLVHSAFFSPLVEYGAPAYFPCFQEESDKLERVQRLGSVEFRE